MLISDLFACANTATAQTGEKRCAWDLWDRWDCKWGARKGTPAGAGVLPSSAVGDIAHDDQLQAQEAATTALTAKLAKKLGGIVERSKRDIRRLQIYELIKRLHKRREKERETLASNLSTCFVKILAATEWAFQHARYSLRPMRHTMIPE